MIPTIRVDAETLPSGSCGENLTWTVDYDLITISGTGSMYDYSEENPAPWNKYYKSTTIVIEEGVTSIGDYAFCDLPWSSVVYFPRGFTEIGEKAFTGTHYLRLRFYGKAPQIAANAFEGNEEMHISYLYGWEDIHFQNYGALELTYGQASVKNTLDTKLIYNINEPIQKEDFVLHYSFGNLNPLQYMYAEPIDMTVGEYDNSTPGSKSVTVTVDGLTFEHQYFVSDGNYLDDITVEAPSILIYDKDYGKELEPVVKLGDIVLTEDTHYTVSYANTKSVGIDGKITVKGKGLFAGFSKTTPLAILKQDISNQKVSNDAVHFTGDAVFPGFTIYKTNASGGGAAYTAYYTNNVNQGPASALLIGRGNYCGHIVHDFTIKGGAYGYNYIRGAYNGQYNGRLDTEQYGYNEFIVPAGAFSVYIDSAYVGDHIALHQLYRIVDGQSILVDAVETGIGNGGYTSEYKYNFQHVYDEGIPEALYMLYSTWVDEEYRVYSAVTMLYVQGKQPHATTMRIDSTINGTYRYGYFGAYGLDGVLGDVTWSSSDDSVASIQDGVLTMYKTGTVTITASSGGISASTEIQVMAEDIGDACIFSFDEETGRPIVLYDGFRLEEGVDYTAEVTSQDEQTIVTITGCGVFAGTLSQAFDAEGMRIEDSAEPEEPAETPTTPSTYLPSSKPLVQNDKVIFYLPENNMAISDKSISYVSGFRQGTPMAIIGGEIYGCSLYEVWTVHSAQYDGEYTLVDRDKNRLHGTDWRLCPLDNGTYALRVDSYQGPYRYMIWSETRNAFTTAYCDPREEPLAQFQLYMLTDGAPDGKMRAPVLKVDDIKLRWEPIKGASSYEIYRSTSLNGTYELIRTLSSNSYLDPDPAMGKTYYYKVKATYYADHTKDSGFSNIVSISYKCEKPYLYIENDSKGKPALSWDSVFGAKQYTVYRATSENGKYTKLGTTKKLTYTDTKAKPGISYYYKIVANGVKSSYNSAYSDAVFCGVICGTPTVTAKVDSTTGKPSLSWKKVDGAASYGIYRKLEGENGFYFLKEVTGTSFVDTTAPIDTKCEYIVQAWGDVEELDSDLSKAVSATSGIAKPAAKGSIDAVSGKPVLSWDAVEGAVKYEIYRSTKSNKSYTKIATVEGLSYTDETVSAGKTYYYKVVAIGAVSKSAESAYVKLTGKCATPEISVTNDAKGKPYLSWEKVSGAKKYTVYRATSENGKYTKLGTTTKAYYTDSKATAGKTYFYKVIANASSSKYNSGYSNIVSCGVNCATPVVKFTNNASGQPVLSWSKVTGAVKYEIYLLGAEDYVTLGAVTGTTWTDESCGIGEGRYYGVRAIAAEEAYNSEVSEPVFGRGTCAPPKPTGKVGENKKPMISWGEVEGATKYVVYRSTSKSKGYKAIGESETLTYEDLTAKKGKTYYYKVVAVGEGFQSAQSSYVKIKSK